MLQTETITTDAPFRPRRTDKHNWLQPLFASTQLASVTETETTTTKLDHSNHENELKCQSIESLADVVCFRINCSEFVLVFQDLE